MGLQVCLGIFLTNEQQVNSVAGTSAQHVLAPYENSEQDIGKIQAIKNLATVASNAWRKNNGPNRCDTF